MSIAYLLLASLVTVSFMAGWWVGGIFLKRIKSKDSK